MMKSVSTVAVVKVSPKTLVEKESLYLFKTKIIFLPDNLY
jgi:hypothetical protein